MDRILFIVPPTIDYEKFKNPPENVRTLQKEDGHYGSLLTDIPLGVLALSAYVKAHTNVETCLVDFNTVLNRLNRFQYASFAEYFREYFADHRWKECPPTIVGISALFTTSYHNVLDIASACRRLFPDAILIAGGGVPTNMHRQICKDSHCFDALIYGEGERALLGLVQANDKRAYIKDTDTAITREKLDSGMELHLDLIEELDEIPLYDYDLLDMEDYRLNPTISAYPGVDSNKRHITYMSSRGCPFRCVFCSAHSIHGREVRKYSLERVREDLEAIQARYGTETIVFQDDHFMASKDRAHAVLDILKDHGLSAFFPNSLTLYALDRPMLESLQSVGVKLLVMAIESGSERVLKDVMHKPLNLDIVRRVMKDCRELGIDTDVNIIIGLPGETMRDIADARAFLKTLYATWFRIYVAVPLVGSEMFKNCLEKGYIKEGFVDGDFKKAVIETEDFTSDEIQKAAYAMNLELNFVHNGDMRLGNYARALKEFQNTIKVKDDHAFAHYFAAVCFRNLGEEASFHAHRDRYKEIVASSGFWADYVREFDLAPIGDRP